jgi:type IV pilus assembly protein PilY1
MNTHDQTDGSVQPQAGQPEAAVRTGLLAAGAHRWQSLARAARVRWIAAAALALAAVSFTVVSLGVGSPPSIPAISLATVPLFAATAGDKPVMALALSVEYPTVGAQYTPGGSTDSTYSNTNEYLGYYDAEACYTYNNAPTETPASGLTATDYKRFDRSGAATSRMCTNGFSGNFLNWASNSAIDMLRLALSGGDRYIDTSTLTILQRAVIPNGDPICMWNSSNFPAKQLQKDGGGAGKYWGAIPTAMVTLAAGNDLWVANTLNRVYFGTSKTGSCSDTSAYRVGSTALTTGGTTAGFQPVPTSLPSDASSSCANENGTCSFTGTKEVWYGAGNNWSVASATSSISCSNGVFGDPIVGTAKKCYYRTPSTTTTSTTTAALNSDGFFYARVQVCDVASSALQDVRDYGLCKQYPNGNFKPTGSIQKYADQLRLAAFGYLMDQTASYNPGGRYGSVLRAPMKFVGAKTFDTNGVDNTVTGGNPNAEWNASTGVFVTNPDGDTTQTPNISGVINYLNKFGRTGPVPGRYKIYDPVGELHYEVLRYLQGLQPSTAAVSSISTDMYDGFPVATSWTDPYGGGRSNTADYSCLKSNIVTIGDINTHDGNRLPSASAANNIPDIDYWRGVVQKFEMNTSGTYVDGQGATRSIANPNTPNSNPPSGSTNSQILGTAYWARTHDIRGTDWTGSAAQQRPGLRVKSFFFDVNEYGSGNNASFRQNNSQFFTAAKYGGFETDSANIGAKPYNTRGNPFQNQDGSNNNDVWQDTAAPGEAKTYYLQSSARGVLRAFDSIFSQATTAARSVAGSAISSKNISPSGDTIFQGAFDTTDWSGDVLSVPLTVSTNNVVTAGTTPNWTAATRLGLLSSPVTSRNIIVGRAGATSSPVAATFTWANIDASLQASFARSTPAAATDTLGQDRLAYLRGDRSREGTTFRTRSKLLGDIVNSGVAYSGTPTTVLSAELNYTTFYTSNASRTGTIFVGANDGMMHAFSAVTGDELFAYIPSWVAPNMPALTAANYNTNHQNYVDATPFVAEAKVGSAGTSADWKTVLVSGTGGGGRGMFALDVTSPTTFSKSNVLWEFTQNDDADMGFVIGRPQILKLRTSAPGATAAYRWFAVVTSGVNNYVADSAGVFSATGKPTLFLLALDKAVGDAWTTGGTTPNYYKISFPIDTTLAATKPTGMINFSAALGTARELTQIFVGDLHGNLWKLNFAAVGSADWNIGSLSAFNKGTTGSPIPYPLFVAATPGGVVQQISMAPALVAGPVVNGVPSTYVAFGTGRYLDTGDKTSTTQNSLYAVYDNGSAVADANPVGSGAISGRGRLQTGSVSTITGVITVPAFTWGRATSDSDTTQRSGWYFDFGFTGERQISNVSVKGDSIIFGSLIPASSGAVGSCAAAGGSGREYQVNIDTGNGKSIVSNVGLLGEPFVAEITGATSYTTSSSTGRKTKTVTSQVLQQGSNGVSTSSQVTTTSVAGRLSWRQINNYQDLRTAP